LRRSTARSRSKKVKFPSASAKNRAKVVLPHWRGPTIPTAGCAAKALWTDFNP
jgi:hypothetical protein